MEEQAAALGRTLTEEEIFSFLKQHGDPMTVARRYRQGQWSLSLGWELIGPELFPMYLIFLSTNLTLTIAAVIIISLVIPVPITAQSFVIPVLAQILCLTLVFTGMNLIRRKSSRARRHLASLLSPDAVAVARFDFTTDDQSVSSEVDVAGADDAHGHQHGCGVHSLLLVIPEPRTGGGERPRGEPRAVSEARRRS